MKLSKESAEVELNKIFEYYEIETSEMTEDQVKALNTITPTIIKGIRKGLIEIDSNDGLTIVQKFEGKETVLRYKELNGNAKVIMGKKPETDYNGRCYALLGSLSGEGEAIIKKLSGPNLKRAEHIGSLLLFC